VQDTVGFHSGWHVFLIIIVIIIMNVCALVVALKVHFDNWMESTHHTFFSQ
jgi:hypothetical protein